MRTTLSFRLISFYATVATVTAFFTLWTGEMIVERQMLRGTDLMIAAEHAEIDVLLSEAEAPFTAKAITDLIRDHTLIDAAIFFFQIDGPDGQVLFRSRNLVGQSLPSNGADGNFTHILENLRLHSRGANGLTVRVGEFRSGGLRVKIASSLSAHLSVQSQFHTVMAAAVPSVFLLSLVVGWLLSQMMLQPLRAIQDTAQRIGAHNLKERIAVPGSRDELSRLAELLNSTFDRLETSFEQVRRFTADSSHELKTPLSIVRLQAEKVLGAENLTEEHRESLNELLGEVMRLEKVINQLLLLARAQATTLQLELTRQSTREYIEQFREDAETLSESEGRTFRLAANADGWATFDPSWIRQVLFNLLSNALRHSPAGTEITMRSEIRDGDWRLEIEDSGPGVPAADLEKIFDRFTKTDSGDGQSDGAGLGLAVCRSIIELHGGEIFALAKSEDHGFRIRLRLKASLL